MWKIPDFPGFQRAGGKTGCTAELAAIARSAGTVTAVNGTFFNACSGGTIVIDGEMHRAAGEGSAVIYRPEGMKTNYTISPNVSLADRRLFV